MGGGTIGQYVGAGVGLVVGFWMGGPAGAMYGAMLGYGIGGMIDAPQVPEQEIDTRDLQFNTFQRNLPVPIVYGRSRVYGNLMWIGNARSEVHKEGGTGGKGGAPAGGGSKWVEYFADFAVALSEGPISSIIQVFLEDTDITEDEGTNWIGYTGTSDQSANYLVQNAISDNPPVWADTAYVIWSGSLGQMNRLPMVSAIIHAIAGGVPITWELGGTWEDYLAAPYNSSTAINSYPGVNVAGDEIVISYSFVDGEMHLFWWRESTGQWHDKGSPDYYNTYLDDNQSAWVSWADYWWWPCTQSLTPWGNGLVRADSDLDAFVFLETPSSKKVEWLVVGDIDYLLGPPLESGANERLFVGTLGGSIYYLQGTTYFLLATIGSDHYGGNIIHFSDISWRIVVLNRSGATYNIYISDSKDPTNFTAHAFPQGNFSICAFQPAGPFLGEFWFIAGKTADSGKYWLYSCDVDGNITEHVRVLDTVDSNRRVTGIFVRGGKLWLSVNFPTQGGYLAGWYNAVTNTITWLNTPSYEWTHGKGSLVYDTNYLRAIQADVSSTNRDVRLSFTQVGFENSPAAAIWDFLTNTRYGMGIPTDKLDQTSFEEVHTYCTEILADGSERYNLDIVLGSHKSALDHLVMMLQSFGGFLVWSEGVIKLRVDKAESSIAAITEDEIITDTFQYTVPSLNDIPNRIKVDIRDRDDEFRHNILFANDEYDQEATDEIREILVQLHGVSRKGQASRLAQYYLDNAITNKIIVTFRVSIKNIAFEVGDVIDVTHSLPGWTQKLFRILEISEQEDEELALVCREYNTDIYHDEGVATQANTDSYIPSLFDPPEHVVHLDAYEKPDVPEIKISFGLPDDPRWWAGAQIFKSVGSNLDYEFVGDAFVISEVGLLENVIDENSTTIYIKRIYGAFPDNGTLIIEDEELNYTSFVDDDDDTGYFTRCTRGQNNSLATTHAQDVVITLREDTFVYGYDTMNELFQTIYFKALSVSPKGVAATPVDAAPEVTIVPIGKYRKLNPVDGLEINNQGAATTLLDNVDCKIDWKGTNRYIGYGKMPYGQHALGYGGGGVETDFVNYQLEISVAGETLRRINTTSETWTYTADMRAEDGTDVSANFTINVRQKSPWNLSDDKLLIVNS